jgi:uncharacterized protein DUF2804
VTNPIRRRGRWRKRWVYVGAFADEVMACAARVEVGPFRQTFWAILDRSSGELAERTKARVPGARGEVRGDAAGMEISAGEASGSLRVGTGTAVEVTCPTSEGNEVWTRKRAGIPVACELAVGERRWKVDALGVTDETIGYHPRHTVWSWSTGVGETADGVAVAWNLVEGVNDPARGSERAIWLAGEPSEPGPVAFDELDAIDFADGSRLTFAAEAERAREESVLGARYSYRQPFGTFAGTLPGGATLARGMGVMEHHDAIW